ncbi:AMP-binding protein [Paraherbaspirillum soli]|uniref:AMP-binding protein n=1 Tax=Paraherbaspirillum soli TaxID=631222 RepID=A0ABW0MBN2_9BURK
MADPRNMLTLLSAASHADQARPFAWRDGRALDFSYFLAQADAWRRLLSQQPGSRFALHLSDSADFACALFGAWQADKTIYLPGDVLPATCANLRAEVDGYLGEFPAEYAPLTMAAAGSGAYPAVHQFKTLTPDFPGLVIYTSGSTGQPQAVPKRLSQLATEVATLEQLFGERIGAAKIVATVSHQHIYGLLFKVLWPLTAGRAMHARHLAFMEELLPQLDARPAVLISSPAHLKRIPESFPPALLRAVFSSGGPLPTEVAQQAGRLLGQVPIEVYGSSETGGVAWRQRQAGTDESWQAMPSIAWRVAADAGVLEIRSPHLPDADWFALADQAQAVDQQRFLLKGRADRIVKVEEKRISLDAIERQLKAAPQVAEARVLMLDGHQTQRQRIAAFVVPSAAGRKILAEDGKLALNRLLRESMAHAVERIALPRSWRYLEALPLNAQGKTTHADLLALLDPNPVPAATPITKPNTRLLEQDQACVVLELSVPPELLYFNGHFDGAPILPGVVQTDWAIAYGRAYFALPPRFLGMHALKFQRVIQPGMVVQLELQHDVAKSWLTFRLASAAGQHASGRVMFGAADA